MSFTLFLTRADSLSGNLLNERRKTFRKTASYVNVREPYRLLLLFERSCICLSDTVSPLVSTFPRSSCQVELLEFQVLRSPLQRLRRDQMPALWRAELTRKTDLCFLMVMPTFSSFSSLGKDTPTNRHISRTGEVFHILVLKTNGPDDH
jgi:hypothetical protein